MTERKEFTPTIRGVDGAGKVTIVLATLNTAVDHDGDVTKSGFFGRQVASIVPAHDWAHVPLGKARIFETPGEAVAELAFNLKVPAAVDWYEAIRYDFENPPALQEYSYGFDVLPGGSAKGTFAGRSVRFLQPLDDGSPGVTVFEVSPVMKGAGSRTRTLAVKRDARPLDGRHDARRRMLERMSMEPDDMGPTTRDVLISTHMKLIHMNLTRDIEAATRPVLEKAFRSVAIGYSEDQPWVVLSEARSAAKAAVETYAPLLGIDPPVVRWFSEEQDEEFADFRSLEPLQGLCRPKAAPGEIWLHSELSAADAWSIAAHEIRHLAGGSELEARVYEEKARFDWSSR